MYIALFIMFAGIIAGRFLREIVNFSLSPYIMAVICILLFVLGLQLGGNDKLLSEFTHIGFAAIVISVFAVLGCGIAAKLFYNHINRGGKK